MTISKLVFFSTIKCYYGKNLKQHMQGKIINGNSGNKRKENE